MKNILFLFFMISSAINAQENLDQLLTKWNKNKVPYISVKTLDTIASKTILLDAREEKEFKVSHLKDAICVGFNNFNLKKTLKKLPEDKNTKIVVYCSLGIRSELIAHQLIKQGYTNVFNLYGGIFEWKNNNYNVFTSEEKSTEKVHAFNKEWSKWLKKGEKVY